MKSEKGGVGFKLLSPFLAVLGVSICLCSHNSLHSSAWLYTPGACSSGLSCPVASGWVCQWEVPAGLKGRKRVRSGCLFPLAPFSRVTKTWLYPLTKGHSSYLVTLSYKHSSYLWAPVTAPSAYYFRGRGGNSPPTAIPVVP